MIQCLLAVPSSQRAATECSSITVPDCSSAGSCSECVASSGCGWSVVRHRCFLAHPVATDIDSCPEESTPVCTTVEACLARAKLLVDPSLPEYGPRSLRAAYRALEHAASMRPDAIGDRDESATATWHDIEISRRELEAKLEAVFDEKDASELLERSRHPALAAVHPDMKMVPRRPLEEAKEFISRGEPVVITGLFDTASSSAADSTAHPVPLKWTLDYLHRVAFDGWLPSLHGEPRRGMPLLNVATDVLGACCRYYEPRRASAAAGNPYPFKPRTHLYRDTFGGFVETLRVVAGLATADGPATLHYLHDVVLDQGRPQVGGRPAPDTLSADMAATLAALLPVAQLQPSFKGFGSAKLWLGQRGIVMPLHYDASE